ncbi:MAG: 50S ribosomal protein L9 [Chloroflexi bacterium]|nr:50S ribosomal protein L9 [Chloroflexota bacterium]
MEILFLEDVAPNHRAGDVKEVKNGYGRNFLIPKGLATLATKGALQQAESLRAAASERRLKEAEDWQVVASELETRQVIVKMRAGPTGRLYGSVTNTMIATEISSMIERKIDRRGIRIPEPIRALGVVKLSIKLFEEVGCEIDLHVVAELDGTELFVDEEPVTIEEAIAAVDEAEEEASTEESSNAGEEDSEETSQS